VLSDHERKMLRELERQFPVGRVMWFGAHRRAHKRRFTDILALVTSVISTATLLSAGSVGGRTAARDNDRQDQNRRP
jgi:hypothetical protein